MVTGLRKSGASTGSAAAFFLGNPALNPAVLVFLAFTLGWQWAVLRLALAIVLVFGAAAAVTRLAPGNLLDVSKVEHASNDVAAPAPQGNWAIRWLKSLLALTISLVPEYVIMILALGAVRAFLFPTAGPQLGNSILIVVGLAVAGMLFAIPTAGEIPIIQTMRGFGMGAGPAGALLMTLAPVSLPSLVMVWRVFPKRVLAILASAVVVAGVAGGLLAMGFGL